MSVAAANSPPVPVIDRASDWLNPILVKETRQALKSRQFVATFMLVLVSGWLISVFGVVVVGTGGATVTPPSARGFSQRRSAANSSSGSIGLAR